MGLKRSRIATAPKKHSKDKITRALAKLVHQKRMESRLTEAAVASYVGISPIVLAAYEAGIRRIPMNHLYALSNCLNISPAAICLIVHTDVT